MSIDKLIKRQGPDVCGGSGGGGSGGGSGGAPASQPQTLPKLVDDDDDDKRAGSSSSLGLGSVFAASKPNATTPSSLKNVGARGNRGKPVAIALGQSPAKVEPRGKPVHVPLNTGKEGDDDKGGSGKRGRPKRWIVDVVTETVRDYGECPDGEKYFAVAANFRRSMDRTMQDFMKSLDSGEVERTD